MVTLIKWIKGFINHPFRVIKGNWFRFKDKNTLLYIKRYRHCNFCNDKESSPIGEICGLCGCPLKSKLRIKEETCELNRWN